LLPRGNLMLKGDNMTMVNQQLVQQAKHRLRVLEVELIEAAQSGILNERDYHANGKKLTALRQSIEALTISEALKEPKKPVGTGDTSTPGRKNSFDIETVDLPTLQECSKHEQRIIFKTLQESLKYTQKSVQDTETFLQMAHQVHIGGMRWFKLIFQLSWQRKRIKWASEQLTKVRNYRAHLESFIKTLSDPKSVHGHGTDLVETFREFEVTTARITKLRDTLHRESSINADQERWLGKYEVERKATKPAQEPPSPAELADAAKEIYGPFLAQNHMAKERLVLAKKLVRNISTEPSCEGTNDNETNTGGRNNSRDSKTFDSCNVNGGESSPISHQMVRMSKKQRIAKKQQRGAL
jgi:hypothetical protein